MTNKTTLTKRQAELLVSLKAFVEREGTGPTVREMARMAGLQSPSAALRLLHQLEVRGHLERPRYPNGRVGVRMIRFL